MNRAIHVIGVLLIIMVGIYDPLIHPLPGLAEGIAADRVDISKMYYQGAADSFWAKINALEEIGKRARETGQVIGFTEVFSEDEINAAILGLVDRYRDQFVQLKEAKVFLNDGSVFAVSSCSILGMQLWISAVPDIWLESGKPRIKIRSFDIQGAPGFINGIIAGMINQRIEGEYYRILQKYENFDIKTIVIKSKQITIAGVAR
jgi:hypothetical protein